MYGNKEMKYRLDSIDAQLKAIINYLQNIMSLILGTLRTSSSD